MWANGARTKNDSAQRGFEARQYFSDEGDVIVADARVRHEASPSWTDGAAIDAKDREFFDQLSRLRVVEGHDVRATRRGVVLGLGKRRREESGQDSRASVIVGQSIDHLIERDQSGGREEPSLTHRSSESLSFNPGAFHQSSRTGEERADRRTETFGQTRHDRGRRRGVLRRARTRRHDGVEQSSTV
jgi:hypothetical protein